MNTFGANLQVSGLLPPICRCQGFCHTLVQLFGSVVHIQPRADLRAERQVGQLFVIRKLAFVGLLVPLTSKTLFSAFILGINPSIGAVDSALILRVAPKERLLYGP